MSISQQSKLAAGNIYVSSQIESKVSVSLMMRISSQNLGPSPKTGAKAASSRPRDQALPFYPWFSIALPTFGNSIIRGAYVLLRLESLKFGFTWDKLGSPESHLRPILLHVCYYPATFSRKFTLLRENYPLHLGGGLKSDFLIEA
jgi:hypothetical protein